jgi:hypothetical protein
MKAERKRVGFWLPLIGLLILVLVAGAGCSAAEARSPGRIKLSTEAFDFGTIPNTDPVSQTFQVHNVGKGTLEILGVSTSCACTTAEVDSRRLPPGEATDLTVTYDPRVHDGATGEFMRVVYVRSDDPDTPEADLTVRVTVVEPAEMKQGDLVAAANDLDVTSLYEEFVCPCCGDDIGSCTCGIAKERRAFVDQHTAMGASSDQVFRAMYQAYGAAAFFDQDLAARAEADLIETRPDDRPVLTVESTPVDLGTIPIDGGMVSTTYTVRNTGESDLAITGLQTSCGCTTAVLESDGGISPVFGANSAENPSDWSLVLAPDEEASLVATFDPIHHGPDATGPFKRTISILSDDPLKARVDVAFEVEVVKE